MPDANLIAGGVQAGSALLSNLFGFGGPTKEQEQMWKMLMGRLGGQTLTDQDITGIIPFVQRGAAGATNRAALSASRRLGLDSGAAQGEIARAQLGPLYQMLGGLKAQQPQINAQFDQNILRMLTQLAG